MTNHIFYCIHVLRREDFDTIAISTKEIQPDVIPEKLADMEKSGEELTLYESKDLRFRSAEITIEQPDTITRVNVETYFENPQE